METYDKTSDFQANIERLEQYLGLNGINNMKKVSALLSPIKRKMYGLLRSLTV